MGLHLLKTVVRSLVQLKMHGWLNILGLGLGFAGFIVSYQYINKERSYDAWNPAYDAIYLVGSEHEGKRSGKVVGALAPAIEAEIPEVLYAGRMNQSTFDIPFITERGIFHVEKWLGADLQVAKMFGIRTQENALEFSEKTKLGILSAEAGRILYHDQLYANGLMMGHSKNGMPMPIDDIAWPSPGPSLLSFDFLSVSRDLAEGFGGVQYMPLVMTFVQLKPGADSDEVARKINELFSEKVSKQLGLPPQTVQQTTLYLDPLRHLHLRPLHGTDTRHRVVLTIGLLSVIILLLAAVNYTNLMMTQVNKRAKEIGLKKVFGVSTNGLALHFWLEIVVQCMIAAGVGWVLVILGGDAMYTWSAYALRVREKEMTIRKVLGASFYHLFFQLNKPFFRVFILASLAAVPVAYFLVTGWLTQFAYRITIEGWLFVVAGLLLVATALAVVSWQTVRAALTKPVELLRNE